MIGRTLGGYRVVEQIGMGGMATVFKAYDPSTDRHVAIKTLPPQYSQDPTFRARFEREAKAIAGLEHIHILPVFSYGEEDGIAYMVMRYLDTGTLSDLIKQGPMALADTIAACATDDQPILVECLTLWLSNILLAQRDVAAESDVLLDSLGGAPGPIVCVANEVGLGIVPENALGRAFRDHAGRLNQQVAARAGRVDFVAAGLPITLKCANQTGPP